MRKAISSYAFASATITSLLLFPFGAEGYSQSYYQGSYSGAGGAANVDSETFTYTGSAQTFTVPDDVSSVRVIMIGGGGGGGGNAAGWGSGGGGGCGGAINGGVVSVTPGEQITVTVGAGGLGGQGAGSGSTGGSTSFGSMTAAGGSWGRTGYYNLYGQYYGGSGGGSGGGGGGNGWPGFQATPGDGGTSGNNTNSHGAGGDCRGNGWALSSSTIASLITRVSWSSGAGGDVPQSANYYGGGGGGGLVIDGSTVKGSSQLSNSYGGNGYGGGGGGHCWTCSGSNGGSGAPGVVYVEWDTFNPTCSISLSTASINQGDSATLSWNSASADTFYISSVGYVSESGTATTSPSVTTTYTGTVTNAYGSSECSATLTVHASCTLGDTTIPHASSTTAYEAASVAYGSSCVSESRTCTDGTLSGTYAYASCVEEDPSSCTLDGVTVPHGESHTFYSTAAPSSGNTCVDNSQLRTCTNGELSGSASYAYGSCSCAAVYTCSGDDIRYTNTSCETSTVASCTAPLFCSAGSAACLSPTPEFVPFGGGSGHLQARPQVVRPGATTRIHWNVSNVESCTVAGENGDSWTGLTSGNPGKLTSAITERTGYILSCEPYEGGDFDDELIYVNIVPGFREQ